MVDTQGRCTNTEGLGEYTGTVSTQRVWVCTHGCYYQHIESGCTHGSYNNTEGLGEYKGKKK